MALFSIYYLDLFVLPRDAARTILHAPVLLYMNMAASPVVPTTDDVYSHLLGPKLDNATRVKLSLISSTAVQQHQTDTAHTEVVPTLLQPTLCIPSVPFVNQFILFLERLGAMPVPSSSAEKRPSSASVAATATVEEEESLTSFPLVRPIHRLCFDPRQLHPDHRFILLVNQHNWVPTPVCYVCKTSGILFWHESGNNVARYYNYHLPSFDDYAFDLPNNFFNTVIDYNPTCNIHDPHPEAFFRRASDGTYTFLPPSLPSVYPPQQCVLQLCDSTNADAVADVQAQRSERAGCVTYSFTNAGDMIVYLEQRLKEEEEFDAFITQALATNATEFQNNEDTVRYFEQHHLAKLCQHAKFRPFAIRSSYLDD